MLELEDPSELETLDLVALVNTIMDTWFSMIETLNNVWIDFGHKLKEKWFGIQITFMENQHKDLMLSIFEQY